MKKMPVIFSGHGSPMIALAHNDLTAAFNHIGQEVISRFGKPKAILSICAYVPTGMQMVHIYRVQKTPPDLRHVRIPE